LHARQQVLVGLHRERDVGVTEPLADHLDRDTLPSAGDSRGCGEDGSG
jgi:hypothetical protein